MPLERIMDWLTRPLLNIGLTVRGKAALAKLGVAPALAAAVPTADES